MALPLQPEVRPVLLRVLAELGGRGRPRDVYPLVTKQFPNLRPEELGAVLQDGRTNVWTNRIQWTRQDLVLAGIIDSSERGVWILTPRGHELAQRDPTADELSPPKRAPGTVRRPRSRPLDPDEAFGSTERPAPEEPAPEKLTPDPPFLAALPSQSEAMVTELRAAAVDSRDPIRLERAVAEAFQVLGFEVASIGGPGKTDVLIHAPLGIGRYSAVIDAKSTSRARVADTQVDWLSIRTHREQERATYACVVGSIFAGGHLNVRAMEFQVTLLTVDELAEVVSLHAEMPLTLTELKALFLAVPSAKTALPQLRAAARERRRKRLIVLRVLAHIDNFNQVQPDIVLAKSETLFASILGERNQDLLGTTPDDVRRTLSLLETIGIISAANGEGYVSDTSLIGAQKMLGAFVASANDEKGGLVSSDRLAQSLL